MFKLSRTHLHLQRDRKAKVNYVNIYVVPLVSVE